MHAFLRWLVLAIALSAAAPAYSVQTRNADDYFFSLNLGDFKAEAADARAAGKKGLLIMFEQAGCPGCAYMKEHVLNRTDVQAFYRERFVNLTIDVFGAIPITDFTGRTHTEKAYAHSIGIEATPTFLFYDLDGNEAVRIVGPVKTVEEFKLLGEFVASGAYKRRQFAEYKEVH